MSLVMYIIIYNMIYIFIYIYIHSAGFFSQDKVNFQIQIVYFCSMSLGTVTSWK